MIEGPRAGEPATIEIRLERLHYGKLAIGEDLRIPASEGYGVTRRSHGLDPARDRVLLPPRLMGLPRFERDHVDEAAQARGCFLARVAPNWPDGEAAPLTLMRARFRPEDGETGAGRLYQQSAIWVADFDTWRRWPAALLALVAGELCAQPDLRSENENSRYGAEALRRRVAPPAGDAQEAACAAPAAMAILEAFADAMERGADAALTFGENEFPDEAAFLATVGLALQALPPGFPRWRDVSVVSGLWHTPPGLCLRYLPSHREWDARVAVS
jgi:hypothetical protein